MVRNADRPHGEPYRMKAAKSIVLLFSIATAILLATSRPMTPFVLLEPGSVSFYITLALFFVTAPCILLDGRWKLLQWPHLILLVFLFLIRPRSFLVGRDACFWIVVVYLMLFVWVSFRVRVQWKLLITSCLITIVALDAFASAKLRKERAERGKSGLTDYGDVIGQNHPGGFVKPNLNQEWLGESPHSKIVTDPFGFRNSRKTTKEKPPNTIRIIFVGDSFVVGMRTDQSQTIGALLEKALEGSIKDRNVEVLIAGQDNPERTAAYVENFALDFKPDLILMGLTLGNDFISAYLDKRHLSIESEAIQPSVLPEEAYEHSTFRNSLIRFDRSLQSSDLYKLARRTIRPEGIYSWNRDYPGSVSTFDVSSGLAYYFKSRIPIIEDSVLDTEASIKKMKVLCREAGVGFAVVIFPQRFQVSDREWNAAMFDYGLDRAAFDRDSPNRRIERLCRKSSIVCIDPTEELRKHQGEALFFPLGDMHLNAKGQSYVAAFLANQVTATLE